MAHPEGVYKALRSAWVQWSIVPSLNSHGKIHSEAVGLAGA